MIDLKGRKKAAPILEPIAAGLAKIGVTPAFVTIVGLAVTVGGAALIATGYLLLVVSQRRSALHLTLLMVRSRGNSIRHRIVGHFWTRCRIVSGRSPCGSV